jgi:PAS domain S-box-containing protein
MPSGAYSFIDVAVLDAVRTRFAAGAALAVLDAGLDRILWANGAGAAILGHEDIAGALGAPSGLPPLARRQIASARGLSRNDELAKVGVRLGGGLSSRVTTVEAGRIVMPNGEDAMLVVLDAGGDDSAARALDGFAQSGFFAALVDQDGAVTASSDGVERLEIAPAALARLVAQVRTEADRLVKRPVEARDGLLPAGIARLADDPALHLVLAIDEPMDQPAAPAAPQAEITVPVAATVETPPTPVDEDPGPAAPEPVASPGRIVRFVWRTDADGHFQSLSDSLGDAVGRAATDIAGLTFEEAMAKLGIDDETDIPALIARRDTWSGRTLMWPIAGTDTRAPVDLAALPIYNRDRRFEGFRGFGVVRIEETIVAPHGVGLAEPEPDPGETHDAPNADETGEIAPDPFQGEPPALEIADAGARRASDKIIRLAEHRAATREPATPAAGLSSVERLAFREIGARLREAGIPEAQAEAVPEAAPEAAPASPDTLPQIEPAAEAAPSLEIVEREATDEALIAGLPVPSLVHAGDTLHFANRALLALTGHADLDALREAGGLDAIFADGEVSDGRLMVRGAGDETHPVMARLQSIGWRGGKALLLTLMPEPEPQPAEPAPPQTDPRVGELEARLAELRTIVDTATDGIVVIAPNGTIRSISRAAEALFGLDSSAVEGSPFADLFATESRRAAGDYLAGLAGNGVASVLNDGREVIGREAQGRFIPLFMTIGRLPGDGGYCAVLRDITHWKRAEEELTQARARAEKASSQKTDFLAHVSHEIRTPLNAIIGFSELMLDEKFGPVGNDRYRDYLRDINRSGNHVLDLVNDLLDISKIEAGEQEMAYEAVSLNDTLAETVAMMQPQANRERVIIRSSFASRLPEVVADVRSMRQIALNLLSNAVRHTPAGGQVIVSTAYEPGGEVLVRIRDTGIGMTLGEIEQALKPFKQINALKRGRGDGTGLGLPLTKALVEANRARFAISSTPSEGTLVEISFPSTRVLAD